MCVPPNLVPDHFNYKHSLHNMPNGGCFPVNNLIPACQFKQYYGTVYCVLLWQKKKEVLIAVIRTVKLNTIEMEIIKNTQNYFHFNWMFIWLKLLTGAFMEQ